jgi:hypothetical protein
LEATTKVSTKVGQQMDVEDGLCYRIIKENMTKNGETVFIINSERE